MIRKTSIFSEPGQICRVRVCCVNKNFNLGHNFQIRSDRAFILHIWIPSRDTIIVYLVILSLKFDLLLKNFNISYYLAMVAARRASWSSGNSYGYPRVVHGIL